MAAGRRIRHRVRTRPARWLPVVGLIVLAAACRTFDYRGIQRDFTAAVAADNTGSVNPLAAAATEGGYALIVEELTEGRIEGLDPRLRANAWMLRAVSEWRTGLFDEARASANRGLNEAALRPGSRDQVILTMIPGLVVDSELRERFVVGERPVDPVTYDDTYHQGFTVALAAFDEALTAMGDATPQDIRYYFAYQKWRIVQNWRQVIEALPSSTAADLDAQDEQLRRAAEVAGGNLGDVARGLRDEIPAAHPLRGLIAAQGGGA